MNDKTAEIIETLAEKLGTTVDNIWAVLLKQAHLNIFINTFESILYVVIIYLYYKFCSKYVDEDSNVPIVITAIIGGVISVILIIVLLCSIATTITCIANPEYWALSQILNALKPVAE